MQNLRLYLTYLAHLKNRALNGANQSLFIALITRLFLVIKYTLLIGLYRKVAVIIGIVRGVAKSGRAKNTEGS